MGAMPELYGWHNLKVLTTLYPLCIHFLKSLKKVNS